MAARKKKKHVQKKTTRTTLIAPDPVAIAKKLIANRGPGGTSIFDVEPIADWAVQLVELKIEKPRELTWKMITQSLTEAAEQAGVEIPASGYAARSFTSWLERRHPKLYAQAKHDG